MLEGLLTWNWQLWYKVNAMIGIIILAISAGLDSPTWGMAGFLYTIIYFGLWFMNFMFNESHKL